MRIPKNTGGHRTLHAPADSLRIVQRWILHEILHVIDRHENNYAYFPQVTVKECASRHIGASWMIKTDIHNYFPSVSARSVYGVFLGLGYAPLVAYELSRLCTWPIGGPDLSHLATLEPPTDSDLVYPSLWSEALPQGAPTSGALANACTREMDARLSSFAIKNRLVYTRYSDDMVFSGIGSFSRSLISELMTEVRKIVVSNGFALHLKKTRVVSPGSRKIVLGLLVQEESIALLPEHRRMIDLYIHATSRYGPVGYAGVRKFESVISFINHVEGWLSYSSHIDEEWTRERSVRWRAALDKHQVYVDSLG
ncbi:RNA-directed DNA polymerase [Plantibacter sp. VKM Ac-2885]|uniref:reverse transcriptase family protein n=1 Tax=Plantibacter sp. VKM Ac-2885 TaxID=2783828 RepID=UPI00188BD727|nr:RNA-directed DNA polymerase [Plantibacter sp. VKM Ac-2885]